MKVWACSIAVHLFKGEALNPGKVFGLKFEPAIKHNSNKM
jgi:hypothetical protein